MSLIIKNLKMRCSSLLVSIVVFCGISLSVADLPDGTLAQILPCRNNSFSQQWVFANDGTNEIRLQMDGKCLDIVAWNTSNDATVWLWGCHPNSSPQRQKW